MRLTATLVLLASLALPATARAQPGPPPDGLYEDFPSMFLAPGAPLTAPSTLLPRWVDVRTRGRVTTVTFEPDERVVWRITWGPHGPTRKTTLVDGAVWTRSRFAYDAAGHLATKEVSGPGAAGGLTFTYTTDATTGEVRTRSATLPATYPSSSTTVAERVEVTRSPAGVTVTVTRDGHTARRDRYDPDLRLLESRFFDVRGTETARLTYARDASGGLRRIRRRIGHHGHAVDPTHPDPTVTSSDVQALAFCPVEHHEALLLLGAPTTATDEGRGARREIHTDFAPDTCWMNATSGLDFDATGLLVQRTVGCICGFCVAAAAIDPDDAASALGVARHWTHGPWVRIDGTVEVTIEHALVTPSGPRAAGTLAPGDVVLAADGTPHVVVSVELLPDDGARLGVNLTTEDGTFAAGGLLFVSETARACEP